jgi:hypothetical protein
MRTFFLRTQKENGVSVLYTEIRKRCPQVRIKVRTGLSVDVEEWNKANTITKLNNYLKRNPDIKIKLESIDNVINDLIEKGVYDKTIIEDAINNIVFSDIREAEIRIDKEREEKRRKEEEQKKAEEEAEKRDVVKYMERFYSGIKNGNILTRRNERYAKNSVKLWHTFILIMKDFYSLHPFTWDEIDKHIVHNFHLFLVNRGYLKGTVNKYFVRFHSIIEFSYRDGLHNNVAALNLFSVVKETEEEKAKEIYLSAKELEALYSLPLTGLKAKVRDLFLIGCYTCQRFSDYSRIEKDAFGITANGTKVVRLRQIKTGNKVVIPILNDNLINIVESYNYDLPKINSVVFNRVLKEVFSELAKSVKTLAKKERTLLTLREKDLEAKKIVKYDYDKNGFALKPRWAMVTSHTARRTGITLLYLTHKFDTAQMMSVSGHKSEKVFSEYIKLSGDEMAEEISKAKNDGLF